MIGGGEGAGTPEKEADVEAETDNDGDAQASEKGAVNLTPGNEGSSAGPTKMMADVTAAEGEVASLTQRRRLGACSYSLMAHTQGAAARKEMGVEGR